MAAVQRKLVHKQFNSPMGLYSPQNVKATLDRELKAFGANGIEIDEHITKPLNLANSAVLRALEEEESEQGGYKRVAWPPVAEDRLIKEFTPQPQSASQQQQYTQPQVTPSGAVPNQGTTHFNQSKPVDHQHYYQAAPYQANQQLHYQSQQPSQQYQQQSLQDHQHQESHMAATATAVTAVAQTQVPYYTQVQYDRQPSQELKQQQYQYHQPQPQYETPTYNIIAPGPQESPSYTQIGGDQYHQQATPPSRWTHVPAPVPQRSGYIQNNQEAANQQFTQNPSTQTPYGSYQQSQAYCAPSAPIGQSYDRYQQHQQPQGIHHSPVPQYNQQQPHQPLVAGHQPSQQSIKPSAGLLYKAPQQQQQQQQQPQVQQQQQQPQYHRQSEPSESPYNYYSQPPQQQPQHPSLQEGSYPQQYRGESPGIITLRKEAPITQKPSPVYTSQPAAAKYQGGTNMRGDLKWPPPEYKEQAAVENEARRQLAAGPVCRPRRINKDYTQFFAKNALNSYYPGYKVPPGTQHMIN